MYLIKNQSAGSQVILIISDNIMPGYNFVHIARSITTTYDITVTVH